MRFEVGQRVQIIWSSVQTRIGMEVQIVGRCKHHTCKKPCWEIDIPHAVGFRCNSHYEEKYLKPIYDNYDGHQTCDWSGIHQLGWVPKVNEVQS